MKIVNIFCLEDLGEHIAKTRKEHGYCQQDFAELIGTSHATLSKLENGNPVSSKLLMRSLQVLGQDITISPKGE